MQILILHLLFPLKWCMCACIYIYVYIYMFVHIYIYIYILTQTRNSANCLCRPQETMVWGPVGALWSSPFFLIRFRWLFELGWCSTDMQRPGTSTCCYASWLSKEVLWNKMQQSLGFHSWWDSPWEEVQLSVQNQASLSQSWWHPCSRDSCLPAARVKQG